MADEIERAPMTEVEVPADQAVNRVAIGPQSSEISPFSSGLRRLQFGKWKEGDSEFAGRAKIASFRASVAQVQWLARESRPDVAGPASLLAAALREPTVADAMVLTCKFLRGSAEQRITVWALDPVSVVFVTASDIRETYGEAWRHGDHGDNGRDHGDAGPRSPFGYGRAGRKDVAQSMQNAWTFRSRSMLCRREEAGECTPAAGSRDGAWEAGAGRRRGGPGCCCGGLFGGGLRQALLEEQLAHLRKQVADLQQRRGLLQDAVDQHGMWLRQMPLQFTVGHYNILAGYMGANMEPWFLYGPDLRPSRRRKVLEQHAAVGRDGRPAHPGWPNYARGVLTDEDRDRRGGGRAPAALRVERPQGDRLLEVIERLNTDVLSLVECDHYEDHFRPALVSLGYESVWRKRPRPTSKDGCCIAWRRNMFDLVGERKIEYRDKRDIKDRIALAVLLRVRLNGAMLCVVSTHLARNPEMIELDYLRTRQLLQLVETISSRPTERLTLQSSWQGT
ncbi:unnamed protein product [Prorocentrum cordatum]|uniref:Uncharacterized protein n=1 Tax=Prorocentrum cordatum TaxID=2364126 RepID=A0ABN9QA21_9DINO|nr:unnamed protein product [Polarella glacialis]